MLIFYFNSNFGGSYSVGPLIALLPVLISLAPYILQGITAPVHESWTYVFARPEFHVEFGLLGWLLAAAVNISISVIGLWGFARFARWVWQNGGWSFLLRLLLQGYQSGPANAQGGPQQTGGGPRRQQQRRYTLDEVAEALTKLPTETYMTPEQLSALPVHDLKALLHGRGLEPVRCLEKGELVRQLLEHGGSSADSCSICCEEYAASAGTQQKGEPAGDETEGDEVPVVLRVLQCGHRFHVECVDKWFLSATDYSRTPACPLCNAPLLREQATASNQNARQR